MIPRLKRALVLLTLNEIEALPKLFDRIPLSAADEVFAVDGGSKDGTVDYLKSKGVRVLGQPRGGRGCAFQVALEATTADVLCYFSPDGNEEPDDIPKMFEKLGSGGYDLVVASRMSKGAHNEEDEQPIRLRKWVNLAFTFLANALWNRGPLVELATYEHPRLGGGSTAHSWPTGLEFASHLVQEILYRVYPALDLRPDHPTQAVPTADRPTQDADRRSSVGRPELFFHGPGQKSHRGRHAVPIRRSRIRRAEQIRDDIGMGRRRRLRDADLLRFLRLHRHGHWSRESGAAGTFRCRAGCGITSISPSIASGRARPATTAPCSSRCSWEGCGTAPAGRSRLGASITADCSSSIAC